MTRRSAKEIADILRSAAVLLEQGKDFESLYDSKGNYILDSKAAI